jgi:hypothetical protein
MWNRRHNCIEGGQPRGHDESGDGVHRMMRRRGDIGQAGYHCRCDSAGLYHVEARWRRRTRRPMAPPSRCHSSRCLAGRGARINRSRRRGSRRMRCAAQCCCECDAMRDGGWVAVGPNSAAGSPLPQRGLRAGKVQRRASQVASDSILLTARPSLRRGQWPCNYWLPCHAASSMFHSLRAPPRPDSSARFAPGRG